MKKMSLTFILIMVGTIISNFLGLLRELVLAYKFGTSDVVDIYIISTLLPVTLFSLFISGITTPYIPIISKMVNEKKKIDYFTSNLLNVTLIVTTFLFIIFILFAENILKVYAYGFNPEKLQKTVHLTQIMFIGIYPISVYMILQQYLNFRGKFVATSFIGIFLNIAWIGGILFSDEEFLTPMGIGNTFGYIFVAIFICILTFKNEFKYNLVLNYRDDSLRKLGRMFTPIFLGLIIAQINGIVDKSIASSQGEGAIAILNYSSRLLYFVYGLLIVTFITFINPKIAIIYNKNINKFKKTISELIIINVIVLTPIIVIFIVFSEDIINILYNRGEFGKESLGMTSKCLILYIISLLPLGIRELINKVFFIESDTKSPLINNIVLVVINIALSLVAVYIFNLGFIALSGTTTIANFVSMVIYLRVLKRKSLLKLNKQFYWDIFKIMVINLIMLFVILVELNFFYNKDKNIQYFFIVWIIMYLLQYTVLIYFSKISIINLYISRKIRKGIT